MNILAFDLGASGGKLFLATLNNDEISFKDIHRFENVSHSVNGTLYWDILGIYKEMKRGIKKAIQLATKSTLLLLTPFLTILY